MRWYLPTSGLLASSANQVRYFRLGNWFQLVLKDMSALGRAAYHMGGKIGFNEHSQEFHPQCIRESRRSPPVVTTFRPSRCDINENPGTLVGCDEIERNKSSDFCHIVNLGESEAREEFTKGEFLSFQSYLFVRFAPLREISFSGILI